MSVKASEIKLKYGEGRKSAGTYWFKQGVYEFLSSSIMETISVMSLDQKSRFLMLGPCSSGGTVPCLAWGAATQIGLQQTVKG